MDSEMKDAINFRLKVLKDASHKYEPKLFKYALESILRPPDKGTSVTFHADKIIYFVLGMTDLRVDAAIRFFVNLLNGAKVLLNPPKTFICHQEDYVPEMACLNTNELWIEVRAYVNREISDLIFGLEYKDSEEMKK